MIKDKFDKMEQLERLQKKKANTQYYIFKEKGKIKKVVRTVFKPNASHQENIGEEEEDTKDIEESSVDDELSCNLDDLLRSFEEEELSQSSSGNMITDIFNFMRKYILKIVQQILWLKISKIISPKLNLQILPLK